MPKIEPQLITVQQAEQEDELPLWGKVAYWLSVILFFKAFVDAVG